MKKLLWHWLKKLQKRINEKEDNTPKEAYEKIIYALKSSEEIFNMPNDAHLLRK